MIPITEHLIFALLGGFTLWSSKEIVSQGNFDGKRLGWVLVFLSALSLTASFLIWDYNQVVSGLFSWLCVYSLPAAIYCFVFDKQPKERRA